MITAWIGFACMIVIIPFHILLILGFPLGEFSLGGKYKVLPIKLRYVSAASVVILLLMIILLLYLDGIIHLPYSSRIFKYAEYFVCGYFIINTLMYLFLLCTKKTYTMS